MFDPLNVCTIYSIYKLPKSFPQNPFGIMLLMMKIGETEERERERGRGRERKEIARKS